MLLADTWYYIEFKATINNTTGSFEVRLNGATEISGTGLDLQTSANAYATAVWFVPSASSPCSTTTCTSPTTSAGRSGSSPLLPGGNGTYSQMVGSDGNSTDNYLLVDEVGPNTTDYVESATVGDKDSYAMGNLPTVPSSIIATRAGIYAAASDAGARSLRILTRSGGTDYDNGVDFALTSTYRYYTDLRETDPATGVAWTESGVNAVEIGPKVTA